MKKMPIHVLADIYWLPPHNPESSKIPPNINFRTICFFTSDLSEGWTAEINCSKKTVLGQQNFYPTRLFFYALDERRDEIRRLSKSAEILITEGFKIIGICRSLYIPEDEIFMDSPWMDS